MSAIFPKWTNRLPVMVIVGGLLIGGALVAGAWYYLTPKYSRVGYKPIQPVAFSHATHAGQLGMDCRYCHNAVEKSWYSNIPGQFHLHELPQPGAEGRSAAGAGARERCRRDSPFPGCRSTACRITFISTTRST